VVEARAATAGGMGEARAAAARLVVKKNVDLDILRCKDNFWSCSFWVLWMCHSLELIRLITKVFIFKN